jgi:polyvinyl alcohol dehydrogenase (cytochrome)
MQNRNGVGRRVLLCATLLIVPSVSWAQAPDGAALYGQYCAQCHDSGENRAPQRDAFRSMPAERVMASMETGTMITMALNRTGAERQAIAEFLTGRSLSEPVITTPSAAAMCRGSAAAFDPAAGPRWSGWGQGPRNQRFQTAAAAALTAADVPRLRLTWAFGFPGDLQSWAQPTVAGGRVFTGSWGGTVYALDAATGCVHWYHDAGRGVRSAIALGQVRTPNGPREAAFFGDGDAVVTALDAATGELLWRTDVDDFPVGRVSGSPTYHDGRLYVGIASGEEGVGAVPTYECCRFRGSVVALDASTGRQLWKTYTIEEPRPVAKNAIGTQLWGPSGAPVWATPAVDERLGRLYVTTGNNYSDPTSSMSDAFLALDLDTGRILWSRQMTENDAYTAACRLPDKTNCTSNGPDFDFGASPILVTRPDGSRVLVAGQKSGIVHALDPDRDGELLWQTRVGEGGTMGGVQWGSAADDTHVYVGVSDIGRVMLTFSNSTGADPDRGGGMHALRLADGEREWYTPPPGCDRRERCSPAQSAAISAMPGVAFSGSVDGHMRAYSTADGRILWDFDSIREYDTVNGATGRGGSIDGPGPAIAGGMVFFTSGYPTAGGVPGNVLLAFSVAE